MAKASTKKPLCIVIAGPNGAGKTTFARALARRFGEANRRYTRMVNCREGWRGPLWQERFHS